MTPKDQIIGLLPKLNAAERADVLNAVKLLGTMDEAPKGPDLINDWIIAGIISYLIKRGLIAERGAHQEMRRRDAYKQYLRKMPAIASFLQKLQDKNGITLRQRPQLAFICASALADLLEKRGYFSVSAMISQIDKIPEALDDQFPGYVQAGIFGFVFREVITGRRIMKT